MKRLLASVALAASLALPAHAEFIDGNDLYGDCSEDSAGFRSGACYGFVSATADMFTDQCLRSNVKLKQVVDVVTIYLRDNPQGRDLPATWLAAYAIRASFCPKTLDAGTKQ